MKNKSVKIAAIFLALFMIVSFAGCTNTGFEGKYTLTWIEAGTMIISGTDLMTNNAFIPGVDYIEFKTNGKYKSKIGGESGKGTYTIQDNTITMDDGKNIATLEGDVLRLERPQSQVFVFNKAA